MMTSPNNAAFIANLEGVSDGTVKIDTEDTPVELRASSANLDASVQEIMAERAGIEAVEAFLPELSQLDYEIRTEAEQQRKDAEAEFEASPTLRDQLAVLCDVGRNEKEVADRIYEAHKTVNADRGLNDFGKQEKKAAIVAAEQKIRDQLRAREEEYAGHISKQYTAPARIAATAEVAPEISALVNLFSIQTPEDTLRAAADELKRARDPNLPFPERYKSNQRLENFYAAAMSRRANSPERFAVALQPAAAKLSKMITEHLKNVKGAHRYEVGTEKVSSVRGQLKFLRQMMKQNGGTIDEYLASVGAPSIFPRNPDLIRAQ